MKIQEALFIAQQMIDENLTRIDVNELAQFILTKSKKFKSDNKAWKTTDLI